MTTHTRKCHNCPRIIEQPKKLCDECRATKRRDALAQIYARKRQQNHDRLFYRPCQWPECAEPMKSLNSKCQYCETHRRENKQAIFAAANARKRDERARRNAGKVRVSPERKKRKAAKQERPVRDGYIPQGLGALAGPPKADDPKRKKNRERELPPEKISNNLMTCACGKRWWRVHTMDVARGPLVWLVRQGSKDVTKYAVCPRCKVGG